MDWRDVLDSELNRVRALLLVMLGAMVFLGVVFWRVQVLGVSEYRHSFEKQSMRRVRLPGSRGRILDRKGVCLADNRPSYCVAVYAEELRRAGAWERTVEAVEGVLDTLAPTLGFERQATRADIRQHIRRRLALPFLAWRDIDHRALARWAESSLRLPGVDIYVEPVRSYPRGTLAAHVLGYVGTAEPVQDSELPYHLYLPEMAGAAGIESAKNTELSGLPGGRLLRVDASGFKHGKIHERIPEPGEDVVLTLDADIQRLAEEALEGQRGAVVILDPSNGDVLALASAPTFDPNVFSPRVSASDWRRLTSDAGRPLVNRAVAGIYPPGSTFKPMVAVASLVNGKSDASTRFSCPGYFAIGRARFDCWRRSGHGTLAMRRAIEQSCNAYFCQLGLECGHERVYRMADAVGFGQRTGIDLPLEVPGILPNNDWKIRNRNDAWRPGDTCNLSIGQGFLAVTPLQMAVFTAAIANGGRIYRPRLARGDGPVTGELVADLGWGEGVLEVVRGGMQDVVNVDGGTGKRARLEGVALSGKTGTAEYGPKADRKKHAWMIAYGPSSSPRYAAVIVIEDAVSGGFTAAPLMKKIMEGVFRLDGTLEPEREGAA